jgi:hypothetical protein
LLLKDIDLWRYADFCEVDQGQGHALPPRASTAWRARGLELPPLMPASIIQRELRAARVDPKRWVVPSRDGQLMRRMQAGLVW